MNITYIFPSTTEKGEKIAVTKLLDISGLILSEIALLKYCLFAAMFFFKSQQRRKVLA